MPGGSGGGGGGGNGRGGCGSHARDKETKWRVLNRLSKWFRVVGFMVRKGAGSLWAV